MSRLNRHKRKKAGKEEAEIDVTTFLNLMVVLIPFLLITAVFSRITIMELDLPTAASGPVSDKPIVTIEVIVRNSGLEISDGKRVNTKIPKAQGKQDVAKLSQHLIKLKGSYRDKEDATVLIEPDIQYEDMIAVMDAVRSAEIKAPEQEAAPKPEQEAMQKIVLFPSISIGDAP